MIYTLTLNPSLDYTIKIPHLQLGETNRTKSEIIFPGGKGVNVSIMLSTLGVDNIALGFRSGFTGDELEALLYEVGCKTDFIETPGTTRINVKIKSDNDTDINGCGPHISEDDMDELFARLNSLKDGDCLVIGGSIPPGLPDDIYEKILNKVKYKDVRFVVDATGSLVKSVLHHKPFLLKPSRHELINLFDSTTDAIDTPFEKLHEYARSLHKQGARNVLVSLGADGAFLLCEDGRMCKGKTPDGTFDNTVGAGDSMVAGFLAGFTATHDYIDAFRFALAAGSATAYSPWLGDKETVYRLYDELEDKIEIKEKE